MPRARRARGREGSRGALDQASAVVAEFPKTAIIAQGHTDSTGSDAHNQSLSERRASSVVNHLMAQGIANEYCPAYQNVTKWDADSTRVMAPIPPGG